MQANEAWIALFRRIPGNLHDTLALGLTTGSEIVVQRIVRLEPDFMIIRGRLAGTQDTGRVIMVPYVQLTFVAIQRELKDAEVEAIFGRAAPVAAPDMPAAPVDAPPDQPKDATPEAAPEPEPTPEPAPKPPSKSALVAKLRDRLKEPRK